MTLREHLPRWTIVALAGLVAGACGGSAPSSETPASPAASTPAARPPSSGILQPGMAPVGTYASPAGTIGGEPTEPWTMTTYGAAVDGKPIEGALHTVVGEVVDVSCYLQLGKHGEAHRSCAQGCFRNGQPMGLLAEDGTLYLLMDEEHDPRRDGMTTLRAAGIEHAAHILEVRGTVTQHDGYHAMYVQGYLEP